MATIGLDKLFYSKITENENGEETYATPVPLAKANEGYKKRIQELKAFINDSNNELTEYDEKMVRKYIKEIRVFDDRFHVFFKAGIDVEITR